MSFTYCSREMANDDAERIHECRAQIFSTITEALSRIYAVANTGASDTERIRNAQKGDLEPPVQEAVEKVRNILNDSSYGYAVKQDTIVLQQLAAKFKEQEK